MPAPKMFSNHIDAVKGKNFSCRHVSSAECTEARTQWMSRHSAESKREDAEERQKLRNELTPEKQIALLDRRLGLGVGAKRERERLQALINDKTDPRD